MDFSEALAAPNRVPPPDIVPPIVLDASNTNKKFGLGGLSFTKRDPLASTLKGRSANGEAGAAAQAGSEKAAPKPAIRQCSLLNRITSGK